MIGLEVMLAAKMESEGISRAKAYASLSPDEINRGMATDRNAQLEQLCTIARQLGDAQTRDSHRDQRAYLND